jgi:hypothetical protein
MQMLNMGREVVLESDATQPAAADAFALPFFVYGNYLCSPPLPLGQPQFSYAPVQSLQMRTCVSRTASRLWPLLDLPTGRQAAEMRMRSWRRAAPMR